MLRVFFMFFGIVWVIMRGVWFLISFDRRLGFELEGVIYILGDIFLGLFFIFIMGMSLYFFVMDDIIFV